MSATASRYSEIATGEKTSPKKKKKKYEIRQVQMMPDRMYTGPVKVSSIGEQVLEGTGSYHWEGAGIYYEGPFRNSQIQGHGTCRWIDGRWYDGDFVEGYRTGDGLFFAADGNCRYKGSWLKGKRHGYGVMVYAKDSEFHPSLPKLKPRKSSSSSTTQLDPQPSTASGGPAPEDLQTPAPKKKDEVDSEQYDKAFDCAEYQSWYIGQWEGGLKHGKGMQQWRKGVVYDGYWAEGYMKGSGSMTWKEDGRVNESYTGQWSSNLPDGEGCHMWEALNNAKNEVDKHTSQQMNNRYEGQWKAGKRHGFGVFHYANGAKYEGHWVENLKQDDNGRFTFEDGSVYCGAFRNDTMVNPPRGKAVAKTTLNIGGEDNPVRLCISIQDLVVFIKEDPTRVVKDPLTGSYNLLLRYMSETKQMYLRYRKVLKSDDDDPYVLTLLQFWCFAKDFRLLSPVCSLARLTRWLVGGPRWHKEKCPTDFNVLEHPGDLIDKELGYARKIGDSYQIQDAHEYNVTMLFRHFLEGLTRVAIARYPYLCDLEKQLEKLFKENIKPLLLVPSTSFATFDMLRAPEWKVVLDQHRPQLWDLFCGTMCNGTGAFGGSSSSSSSSRPRSDTVTAGGLFDPAGTSKFVSNSRRAHINGRQIVTTTFKKVLQLWKRLGLLKSRLNLVVDLNSAVIPALLDDVEGDDDLGILKQSITRTQLNRGSLNYKEEKKQGLNALFANATGAKPEYTRADRGEGVECTQQMATDINWIMSLAPMLECMMDSMHPGTVAALRWHASTAGDYIGIADFLETEINFSEFLLFLKEYSIQGCRNPDGTDILNGVFQEDKFDAFVKWVFLPSTESPYVDPTPPPVVPEDEDEAEERRAQLERERALAEDTVEVDMYLPHAAVEPAQYRIFPDYYIKSLHEWKS
ncbi:unnamed protein product [Amoebophrya sp. A120]|nr:unnamed protein product [Amoebophrya sp. A120]|eukprot:GSA120T00017959001.1